MNENVPNCKNNYLHKDKIEHAKSLLINDEDLFFVTQLFKILGDETRTKILSVLIEDELCVCDIAKILDMTKSAISHQLKTLRIAKLIKSRKIGKEVFYSLKDDHVFKIYKMATEHVAE